VSTTAQHLEPLLRLIRVYPRHPRSLLCAFAPSGPLFFLTICAAISLAGCTAEKTASIHGKVTLDNEPVANGSIVFLPTSGAGKKAAAAVEHGLYSISASDQLPAGSYRVEISWRKPTGRQISSADPGIMTDETREAIPARYNIESTLTTEFAGGEVEKNFDLLSK
jgi:hypothetical protein